MMNTIAVENPILQDLNPEQCSAVVHGEGPLLILAGAGSGKTRVITHRAGYLISQGVQPWNILAITFTNRAADEMKRRVHALVPGKGQDVWISTFHSFCARFLRKETMHSHINPHFVIYDERDQKNVVKRCLVNLKLDEKKFRPGHICELISRAKDDLLDAASFAIHAATSGDANRRLIGDIYEAYDEEMKRAGALDFGDLIMKTVETLRENPALKERYENRFHYVMVDEYQDTNRAQYVLVKYLTATRKNIAVVGDDDQAIYRWRGADIRNILEFEKDYKNARVIKLEQNYRSTKVILDAAWQVVKHNMSRKEKKLWTSREGGEPVTVQQCGNEQDEAVFVASEIQHLCSAGGFSLKDCAVFYRTNAQSRVLEDALRRMELPYRIFGSVRFYDRQEVKDILSYATLLINPADSLAVRRTVNTPGRGIGKTTIEQLDQYAVEQGISLFETVCRADTITGLSPRIRIIVAGYKNLIRGLAEQIPTMSVKELFQELLNRTGYLAMLEDEDTPEADSRIGNLKELITAVSEYEERSPTPSLAGFLEEVALISDVDTLSDDTSYVTLMTVHLAKGLEFSHVFLTGLEEGLFPIGESLFDQEELEEERRLAYVGMTRAKNKLYLIHAAYRKLYGQRRWNLPSRFIAEAGFVVDKDTDTLGTGLAVETAAQVTFSVGARVKHEIWGMGTITEKTGSNDSLKVMVQFDSGKRKKIMVKYAPIQKL